MKELQMLEDFYAFISKKDLSLEDVWERLASRTGNFGLFALRNGLGLVGSKAETHIQTTGLIWPSDLPPAEWLYTAMRALLRVDFEADRGLPKDRFILLRKWLDAEAQINKILDVHEVDQTLCAEASGARLRAVMNTAANHPEKMKSREDVLKLVEMMLELEPRATTSYLLFDSVADEKNAGILLDMVLRQGLLCIEDTSLLSLMSLCEKLFDRLIQLGRPRCAMTFKELPMASSSSGSSTNLQAMAEIPLVRKQPNLSMRRTKTIGDFGAENDIDFRPLGALRTVQAMPSLPTRSPIAESELPSLELSNVSRPATPTSMPSSTKSPATKSPKLPSLTTSPVDSGRAKKDTVAVALDSVAPSDHTGNSKDGPKASGGSRPSTPAKDETPCKEDKPSEKKFVRRNVSASLLSTKMTRSRTRSFSDDVVVDAAPKQTPERTQKLSHQRSEPTLCLSVHEKCGNKTVESRKVVTRSKETKAMSLVRRRSIDADAGSLAAAARAVSQMTDAEWELSSCQLLWSSIPPQTITYAIGISLHSVGSRKLRSKIIRTAWSLLDKARAVDCILGKLGTKRLRLEMDTLLDQFNRSLHVGKGEDAEDLAPFLDKVRLTMVHLQSICEAESRFAQVAVLYGIAFIAEVMCTWAEQTEAGASLAKATRDLSRALSPHLQQLFQRRLDSEGDMSHGASSICMTGKPR